MWLLNLLVVTTLAIVYARHDSNDSSQEPYVHTMEIDGNEFVDSDTGERFLIRGIDYQPGGSASYTKTSDPLSDVEVCARDVYLFQKLGINTVRVYTINPRLNHDACMTMLAAANIYLLLDVNSPLVGESINRYEPWTTYTPDYLRHVFEVVDQFSRYNNTLGFFIGNEIVNDERSAAVSPPYVKAVTRDVKDYMYYNCHRSVPLGYSAADDLRYRKQLSHYLTCGPRETAVDFYGVNSYQWCGKQTIRSSGYDVLIKDHADFKVPVFFSEFGCNLVKPRLFQEVSTIFSPAMTDTFSGGLVYEFTQEENDYGLVDIDKFGNALLRDDFATLQKQYKDVSEPEKASLSSTSGASASSAPITFSETTSIVTAFSAGTTGEGLTRGGASESAPGVNTSSTSATVVKISVQSNTDASSAVIGELSTVDDQRTNETVQATEGSDYRSKRSSRLSQGVPSKDQLKTCLSSYPNLSGARLDIPDSFGTDMIRNGVRIHRGKYLHSIFEDVPASKYDITLADGHTINGARMQIVNDFRARSGDLGGTRSGGLGSSTGSLEEVLEEKPKAAKGRKAKSKESKTTSTNAASNSKGLNSFLVYLMTGALLAPLIVR